MFFNGFHHYSHYIDYFSMNCVPQLAKKGGSVVVSDSPVPVAKIDTACKSNISIFTKKITKILVLTWEISRLNDFILIFHVLSSSTVRTTPFFSISCLLYMCFRRLSLLIQTKVYLSASFVCNWRFSFFCEILLHKYHIDGKHVRVYHSRICQQTSFLAMAISKYGHWRGGA